MSDRRLLIQFASAESRERAYGIVPYRNVIVNNGSRGWDIPFSVIYGVISALEKDGFHMRVEVIS